MIKLKSLLKMNEAFGRRWSAFWLDPLGKSYEVGSDSLVSKETHWKWAKNYLNNHHPEWKTNEDIDPSDTLKNEGWVRIAFNYYGNQILAFDYFTLPYEVQLRAIKNLAKTLGAKKIVDDTKHKEINEENGLFEEKEPTDSDQWDVWYDYLDYFDGDINKEELIKIIKRHHLNGKTYLDKKVVKLWDKKTTVYLEYDEDSDSASLIKDIEQWIYDVDYYSLGISVDTMYNGHVDSTLKDLKQHPGQVYHYTTEEKWEEIQSDGKMIGSYGTGINNRGAYGIFTSTDPEEYALGTYGNICLELDLQRFKEESGLPELNLEFEPEVEEYLIRDYIRSVLEIENREDTPSDISPYTVIVNHVIPLNYIKVYGN